MTNLNPAILEKLQLWRKSPLAFVHECIEVTPSSQQIDALQEIGRCKRLSVRSGHGTGKDAMAAWTILWWVCTRPYAKVVCTAPTGRQLKDILWSEISKWLRKSKMKDEFIIQSEKIYHVASKDEWWIRAISSNVSSSPEEQAETLAGLHDDHLLIVIDESSGVPDPVYTTLEGAITRPDNKVLLIGNMTKTAGYFYDTHFHPEISKHWSKLHWSSAESSNVDPAYPAYMAAKYGKDSSVYAVRVLGEPPFESDDTLIPLGWATQCIGREVFVPDGEPLFLSADIARYGEDRTIIMPRRGLEILPWMSFQGLDTMSIAQMLQVESVENRAEGLAIDEIGVGAGVVDWLYKHNVRNTYGVNVATKSSDPTKYSLLRDELWWRVRERCRMGEYSFPDIKRPGDTESLGQALANELSSVKYEYVRGGSAIKVESKKELKRRGYPSPNIADALCLSEYFGAVAHIVLRRKDKKKVNRPGLAYQSSYSRRDSWMVA